MSRCPTLSLFNPELTEDFVEKHLQRMYTGNAPTLRQAAASEGDSALNAWLKALIEYMFAFTDIRMDHSNLSSLIRSIRTKYGFLKLTEVMHYVFLFRTGEFGKIYGKADGLTVMITMKEYCSIREQILADIRRSSPTEVQQHNPKVHATPGLAEHVLHMLENYRQQGKGSWRNEPYGSLLARWYNCKALPDIRAMSLTMQETIAAEERDFPGNWTPSERYQFALQLGWNPTSQDK